jgi:hypothetical protein
MAWRENTASPANRAIATVIQITPATGPPAAGGTITALLNLILTSTSALSLACVRGPLHAQVSFDKLLGVFAASSVAPLRESDR